MIDIETLVRAENAAIGTVGAVRQCQPIERCLMTTVASRWKRLRELTNFLDALMQARALIETERFLCQYFLRSIELRCLATSNAADENNDFKENMLCRK
jgi:hypothetical protein